MEGNENIFSKEDDKMIREEDAKSIIEREIEYEHLQLLESIFEKNPHAFDRVYTVTAKELKIILQKGDK